jgi:hypothetical protein
MKIGIYLNSQTMNNNSPESQLLSSLLQLYQEVYSLAARILCWYRDCPDLKPQELLNKWDIERRPIDQRFKLLKLNHGPKGVRESFSASVRTPKPLSNVAKKILIEELEEQAHPERVEDVIFWALEYYYNNRKLGTWGETIAFHLIQRIKDAENDCKSKKELPSLFGIFRYDNKGFVGYFTSRDVAREVFDAEYNNGEWYVDEMVHLDG